jgi:hypothetical protein
MKRLLTYLLSYILTSLLSYILSTANDSSDDIEEEEGCTAATWVMHSETASTTGGSMHLLEQSGLATPDDVKPFSLMLIRP